MQTILQICILIHTTLIYSLIDYVEYLQGCKSTISDRTTDVFQSVRVNRERVLHEGDEFILSCLAQGSTAMEFRWFKDGVQVNDSLALRYHNQELIVSETMSFADRIVMKYEYHI